MSSTQPPPSGPRQVGALGSWLLATLFALLLTPVLLFQDVGASRIDPVPGSVSELTLRLDPLRPNPVGFEGGAIAVHRGERIDRAQAEYLRARPGLSAIRAGTTFAALLLALWGLLRLSARVPQRAPLRQELATLGLLSLGTALAALVLSFSSYSILAIPCGALALAVGYRSGPRRAVPVAIASALLTTALLPMSPGIAAVLVLQAVVPHALLGRRPSVPSYAGAILASLLVSSLAAFLAFGAAWNEVPEGMFTSLDHSPVIAAALGALLSGIVGLALRPFYDWLCGEVSKRRLGKLEKLSQPILRQIAEKAPGTWQHSLAMANLAQAAGEAIGADTQLLRVGAYYHDLGKTLQPKFFIENLGSEPSPHEKISPKTSKDGICQHVSEGVRMARGAGLPERIVDFVRSHHGAGTLEYFLAKERTRPGREDASIEDFQYPGTLPTCRETGILCIVDAVEGAARSLKNPGPGAVAALVSQIAYGKLQVGQLDDCGLTLPELAKITDALITVLEKAHEPATRKAKGADAISTQRQRPGESGQRRSRRHYAQGAVRVDQLGAIRLDSLDMPHAQWREELAAEDEARRPTTSMALAKTENMESDPVASKAAASMDKDIESRVTDRLPATPAPDDSPIAEDEPPRPSEPVETVSIVRKGTQRSLLEVIDDGSGPTPLQQDPSTLGEESSERLLEWESALEATASGRIPNEILAQREATVTEEQDADESAASDQRDEDTVESDEPVAAARAKDPETREMSDSEAISSLNQAMLASDGALEVAPADGAEEPIELPRSRRRTPSDTQKQEPVIAEPEETTSMSAKVLEALTADPHEEETAPATALVKDIDMSDLGGDGARPVFKRANTVRRGPPGPPPGHKRHTIPLGEHQEFLEPGTIPGQTLPDVMGRKGKRADSSDGLRPGEVVLGPPPATHPETPARRSYRDVGDVTVRRKLPVPSAAMRPDDDVDDLDDEDEDELAFKTPNPDR